MSPLFYVIVGFFGSWGSLNCIWDSVEKNQRFLFVFWELCLLINLISYWVNWVKIWKGI